MREMSQGNILGNISRWKNIYQREILKMEEIFITEKYFKIGGNVTEKYFKIQEISQRNISKWRNCGKEIFKDKIQDQRNVTLKYFKTKEKSKRNI